MAQALTLRLLPEVLAVCRLPADAEVPAWFAGGGFHSLTRTDEELSVIAPEQRVPEGVKSERGFRLFRVEGQLDFSAVGILASLTHPLAEAGIPILSVSTFDTDYLLVRESHLKKALAVLRANGHTIAGSDADS